MQEALQTLIVEVCHSIISTILHSSLVLVLPPIPPRQLKQLLERFHSL